MLEREKKKRKRKTSGTKVCFVIGCFSYAGGAPCKVTAPPGLCILWIAHSWISVSLDVYITLDWVLRWTRRTVNYHQLVLFVSKVPFVSNNLRTNWVILQVSPKSEHQIEGGIFHREREHRRNRINVLFPQPACHLSLFETVTAIPPVFWGRVLFFFFLGENIRPQCFIFCTFVCKIICK